MMKKFLVLGVVLALSSSAMAGLVGLRVEPGDVEPISYDHSTTITIEVYASGFYIDYPYDTIGFMDIASIQSDNGGTASSPSLHTDLLSGVGVSAGDIVNSGGILIENIGGYIDQGDIVGVYPFPAVLYAFELHIPELPNSTILTITMSGLVIKNLGYNDPVPGVTATNTLEIHIIPEPMTIALLGLGGLFLRRRR